MSVEKAIWSAYIEHPCRPYSMRELSLKLKKSYPLIHQHLTRLISQNKFSSRTIGRSVLCFPNYSHPYTILELAHADLLHTQRNEELQPLYAFLTSKDLPGLLSAWISNQKLVILLATNNHKEAILKEFSKTTFTQQITFLTIDEMSMNVNVLVDKSNILCGFEQFHVQIKLHYREFASYSHMVLGGDSL